jgi:hypothetical protein
VASLSQYSWNLSTKSIIPIKVAPKTQTQLHRVAEQGKIRPQEKDWDGTPIASTPENSNK